MLKLLTTMKLMNTNIFGLSRRLFSLTQSVGLKKSNDYLLRIYTRKCLAFFLVTEKVEGNVITVSDKNFIWLFNISL
jgi:hypothetical protein